MKRILFVDDEQHVLDGLRNLLRKQRQQWEMVFALGGEQALVELARGRFDVVVSDMRMPGMDGVALLRQVMERQPAAARIILSGHAERQSVVAALPVSHQYLSKPCDAETLRTVVERASGLQSLLHDERVRSLVGKVDRLPSAPKVYWELTQKMAEPSASLPEIASIVERDSAMAAKVLQLVNSSYFGLAHKQASIAQAVSYLGTELLSALALSTQVFTSASGSAVPGFSLDALQQHSVLVARIAKSFLRDKSQAEQAFVAALMHDIGKIVLATSLPERYGQVLDDRARTGRPEYVVEHELLGAAHAEVGACLLGLWGLPLDVVETVAYHHRPELAAPTGPLLAVHVADALSHGDADALDDPTAGGRLNVAWLESSPYGPELPRWRALARSALVD